MDERSRDRLHALDEPALPFLDLIEGGAGLWEALAGADAPADVRAVQTRWQPGRSLTVRYQAVDPESGHVLDDFVAYAASRLPDGVTVLRGTSAEVAVWRLTDDPWLPGMRAALDPAAVRELLVPLGVPRAPVALHLRAYRPGRRAVVEVRTGEHGFFLKVLRPSAIAALQQRHRALEGVLPVPASHGWSDELGLVVLEARGGVSLREGLARGEAVPPATDVLALLDRLPPPEDERLSGLGPARSQVQAGIDHLPMVRRLAPDATRALDGYDLASLVGERRTDRTVHGDVHEAQLLVEDGRFSALLDVDTAGAGDPRDDWATFLGHLAVQAAEATGEARARYRAYAREVAAVLDSLGGEPAESDARVAAVILGLATGGFAAMAPNWADLADGRVALAASWLGGGGRDALLTDESELIRLSPAPHPQSRT